MSRRRKNPSPKPQRSKFRQLRDRFGKFMSRPPAAGPDDEMSRYLMAMKHHDPLAAGDLHPPVAFPAVLSGPPAAGRRSLPVPSDPLEGSEAGPRRLPWWASTGTTADRPEPTPPPVFVPSESASGAGPEDIPDPPPASPTPPVFVPTTSASDPK